MISWWIFVLVAFGLAGNAFLAWKLWQGGQIGGAIVLTICFVGACVYLYRTYDAWDEIRGLFKD